MEPKLAAVRKRLFDDFSFYAKSALRIRTKEGFRVLKEDCPDWLSWGILASIAASFGLKSIGQFRK